MFEDNFYLPEAPPAEIQELPTGTDFASSLVGLLEFEATPTFVAIQNELIDAVAEFKQEAQKAAGANEASAASLRAEGAANVLARFLNLFRSARELLAGLPLEERKKIPGIQRLAKAIKPAAKAVSTTEVAAPDVDGIAVKKIAVDSARGKFSLPAPVEAPPPPVASQNANDLSFDDELGEPTASILPGGPVSADELTPVWRKRGKTKTEPAPKVPAVSAETVEAARKILAEREAAGES